MKRTISTGFMAVYWIALPLSTLLMLGMGWIMVTPDASSRGGMLVQCVSFAASVVLTLLIVWRIWTHDRARRSAKERTSSSNEVSNSR